MKKLTFIIAALAMSGAVFAQTIAKDSIAAAKAAEKERIAAEKAAVKAAKEKKAADLKAFKEKQKQDLAAFVKAQNSGKSTMGATFSAPAVEMKNEADSLAHTFGIAQSNGLKQYIVGQMGVDTAYIDDFCRGIMERVNVDPANKSLAAFNAGGQIGGQIVNMTQNLSKDYYAAEPEKSIDAKIVAHGIIQGLLGQNEMRVDSASQVFQKVLKARQDANKEATEAAEGLEALKNLLG